MEALDAENTSGPLAGLEQLVQVSALLDSEPDARKLLVNPVIPPERRGSFVAEVIRVLRLDSRVGKLLGLIVERRRLDILEDLIEAYRGMLDERNNIVRAVVTSANPLSVLQQHEVGEKLEKSLGKRVVIEVREDPSLIGGLVVRIGSTVYDGTLLQHLAGFKERLLAN